MTRVKSSTDPIAELERQLGRPLSPNEIFNVHAGLAHDHEPEAVAAVVDPLQTAQTSTSNRHSSVRQKLSPPLMAKQRCRSGDHCKEPAGFGRWGTFCEAHAEQLAAIAKTYRRGPNAPAKAKPVGPIPVQQKVTVRICGLDGCDAQAWKPDEPLRCFHHQSVPADVTEAPEKGREA
jgi:hypothetical protein